MYKLRKIALLLKHLSIALTVVESGVVRTVVT